MPSSTISTLSRQLENIPARTKASLTPGTMRDVLDSIPDSRKRRGIRHGLTGILALAVCAVLSRAKSFAEIAEWAADTGRSPLAKAGIKVPHVTTIQRVLASVCDSAKVPATSAALSGHFSSIFGRPQRPYFQQLASGTGHVIQVPLQCLEEAVLSLAGVAGRAPRSRHACSATGYDSRLHLLGASVLDHQYSSEIAANMA